MILYCIYNLILIYRKIPRRSTPQLQENLIKPNLKHGHVYTQCQILCGVISVASDIADPGHQKLLSFF